MFQRRFFKTTPFLRTKLGHAAITSIAAMTAMIALTTQMTVDANAVEMAGPHAPSTMFVELA